jgi:hypothetical protein
MNDKREEALVKAYEGRLKSLKERHKVEIDRVQKKQEQELKALDRQYKAQMSSKPTQLH